MKKILEFLFLSVAVITSSCNIDEVVTALPAPQIVLDAASYRMQQGDEIRLAPTYKNADNATFSWSIAGIEVGCDKSYVYTAAIVGTEIITITVSTPSGNDSKEIAITSIEPFTVYDYTPAPGQFIGDNAIAGFSGTEYTADSAKMYAERRLTEGRLLSLGAFGGYVVIGFGRSVYNHDSYDFAIEGNAFPSSSEPGIVWVMQDNNKNGVPDDIWYELSGSETGKSETIQEYEVTYYRPANDEMSVEWRDNYGNSGTVEYLKSLHNQPSYYPQWLGDSYTLRGTRLKSRSSDVSGNGSKWTNPAFDWGYADNASTIDGCDKENTFDISNAIDNNGLSIHLDSIDFIKVQSAIQQQCGWVGELSTEVLGFRIIDNE